MRYGTLIVIAILAFSTRGHADWNPREELAQAIPKLSYKMNEAMNFDSLICEPSEYRYVYANKCRINSVSGLKCEILFQADSEYVHSRLIRSVCMTDTGPEFKSKVATIERASVNLVAESKVTGYPPNARRQQSVPEACIRSGEAGAAGPSSCCSRRGIFIGLSGYLCH